MKTNYNTFKMKTLLMTLSVLVIFYSCQDDDSIPRRGKPAVTLSNNVVTVTEGETAVFELNLEYPVANKVDIRIDVLDEEGNPVPVANPTNGDPTTGEGFYDRIDFEDFNVPYNTWFESGAFAYGYLGGSGYVASIPPFAESFDLNIETILDALPEGTKSYNFRLTATSLMEGTINEEITVNIEDFVSNDLIMTLEWDGDYLDSPCDDLDFDLELIYDGDYIQTSYSNCPEEITILADDVDGDYILDVSLWEAFVTGDMDIPVSLTISKPGVFVETVDLSSFYPLSEGGDQNGNPNAYISFFIEKNGTTYTVTDSNNTQIAQGRMANYRMTKEQKMLLKIR